MIKSRTTLRLQLAFSIALVLAFSISPARAQETQSKADKYAESAQRIFENGNFTQAERTFKRALGEAQKTGDQTTELKMLIMVGKSQQKSEKFTAADETYKQALALCNDKNLDQTPVKEAMTELDNVYRTIDRTKLRSDVSKFIDEIGTQIAYATKTESDPATHVSVNLGGRYQRSVDELYKEYAPPSAQAETEATAANAGGAESSNPDSINGERSLVVAAGAASLDETSGLKDSNGLDKPSNTLDKSSTTLDKSSNGLDKSSDSSDKSSTSTDKSSKSKKQKENPVKAIKLEKKITFDIIREDANKYRVAKINGLFANVGMWVKLSELLIAPDGPQGPYAEVRAGKFGIEKCVKVDIPEAVYKQLKDGVDQVDPFIAKVPPSAPNSVSPNPGASDAMIGVPAAAGASDQSIAVPAAAGSGVE